MSIPMEDDEDSSSELPSFADLAKRLEETGSEPARPGRSEPTAGSDESGQQEALDESRWQWGPRSTDSTTDAGEPTPTSTSHAHSNAKSDALLDLIADAGNVLVLGPSDSSREFEICTDLCSPSGNVEDQLLITAAQSPDERLNALRGYGLETSDRTTVIAVGQQARSVSYDRSASEPLAEQDITVESVANEGDLTRLGLLVNRHLADSTDESSSVLCFHTLSSLLDSVEIEKLFRFLHILSGRVDQAGATAHYHLDPETHPENVVETLKPIFDVTVRFSGDGGLSVDH